jgi:enoyl-CoA hydratase/carnithine racemase
VVPEEKLAEETRALLRRATRGSPLSKGIGKRAFYRQIDLDTEAAYEFASEVMADASQTGDARENLLAFLEKRPPRFTGR